MRAIIILTFLLTSTICWADNSIRIKELTDESHKVAGQIDQAQRFIQECQVKIIGNSAIVEELKKQDIPKEEKKEEPK